MSLVFLPACLHRLADGQFIHSPPHPHISPIRLVTVSQSTCSFSTQLYTHVALPNRHPTYIAKSLAITSDETRTNQVPYVGSTFHRVNTTSTNKQEFALYFKNKHSQHTCTLTLLFPTDTQPTVPSRATIKTQRFSFGTGAHKPSFYASIPFASISHLFLSTLFII